MTADESTKHKAELAKLVKKYREASRALDAARTKLIAGLRDASGDGIRQADLVRAIDHEWTREYVRKVLTAVEDQPRNVNSTNSE